MISKQKSEMYIQYIRTWMIHLHDMEAGVKIGYQRVEDGFKKQKRIEVCVFKQKTH